jgi:pyrroline-5-carboxylate reductase
MPPSDLVRGPLVIVGGGRMGEALLTGLARAGWPAAQLAVVEKDPERRQALKATTAATITTTVAEAFSGLPSAGPRAGAVVAVKPADVPEVCKDLKHAGAPRVLSIAAGVPIAVLEESLGSATAVLRAMPNTPALVGAGASAIAAGRSATTDDEAWGRAILESVGTVVDLPESALDAVTGLSGSGPAYVFLVAEALIEAGLLVGLPRPVAKELAVQTLLGSARLLAETGDEPATLRAAVTSPGGTTAAGLRALEAAGVRAAILDAVAAATARSREMGQTR